MKSKPGVKTHRMLLSGKDDPRKAPPDRLRHEFLHDGGAESPAAALGKDRHAPDVGQRGILRIGKEPAGSHGHAHGIEHKYVICGGIVPVKLLRDRHLLLLDKHPHTDLLH